MLTAAALTLDIQRVPGALAVTAEPHAPGAPRGDSTTPAVPATDLDPGDDDLLTAIARGEHPALLALYDRDGGISYGLAFRILQECGAAEEAVQDAHLGGWRKAASFDVTCSRVRPWLLSIVHHCAIDLVRGRGSMPPAVVSFDEMIDQHAASDTWIEVSLRAEREHIRAAVAALPLAQGRTIEMAYLTHRDGRNNDCCLLHDAPTSIFPSS